MCGPSTRCTSRPHAQTSRSGRLDLAKEHVTPATYTATTPRRMSCRWPPTGFDKANGLAFSPDGATLYVGDNGAPHHRLAYDVVNDRRLVDRRVVAVTSPEHTDGIKVDRAGRIYVSAPSGIEVLAATGERLGEIHLPGVNFTFGGPAGNVIFITADTAIWAAVLNARGA
jgi:gluconolactonase